MIRKGDLSAVRYDFLSNQTQTAQIRRYFFDENHLPTRLDVYDMEGGESVAKETITFHKTYAQYLPTGVQSCRVVHIQTQEGVSIWKIKNPTYGTYTWRLVSHTWDTDDVDGVSYFVFAIYEYIFTADVFYEICQYAKENTNGNIAIGISGWLFVTPQQEAIKIAEMAKIQNITYQFLS